MWPWLLPETVCLFSPSRGKVVIFFVRKGAVSKCMPTSKHRATPVFFWIFFLKSAWWSGHMQGRCAGSSGIDVCCRGTFALRNKVMYKESFLFGAALELCCWQNPFTHSRWYESIMLFFFSVTHQFLIYSVEILSLLFLWLRGVLRSCAHTSVAEHECGGVGKLLPDIFG